MAEPQTELIEAVGRSIARQRNEIDASVVEAIRTSITPLSRSLADVKQTVIGLARQRASKPAQPSPVDTIVKAITARVIGSVLGQDPEKVAVARYGESSPPAVAARDMTDWWKQRAITSPAQTTVANWAAELAGSKKRVDLLASLAPQSAYSQLSARGLRIDFSGVTTVGIPTRVPSGTGMFFVGEGSPLPVRSQAFGTLGFAPHKGGFISLLTKEIAKHSSAETVIRAVMAEDAAIEIDSCLLDNAAASAIRPAGLLNGATVVPPPAAGASGLDDIAARVSALLGALPQPVVDPALILNPIDAVAIVTIAAALGPMVITSSVLPAGTLVALDAGQFMSGEGDTPIFDTSEEAVIHRDTAPLPISDGGVLATPTSSMFQQGLVAIRILQDVSWSMRRPSVAVMTLA